VLSTIFCLCTPVNMEMNVYNDTKQWTKLYANINPRGITRNLTCIQDDPRWKQNLQYQINQVNFKPIDFAVNSWTVANHVSKIHKFCCRYYDVRTSELQSFWTPEQPAYNGILFYKRDAINWFYTKCFVYPNSCSLYSEMISSRGQKQSQ